MSDPSALPVDLLPAFIGALVALILKPLTEFIYNRCSETRAYYAHTADRIRDFRESVAVLDSILLEYERKKFPIDTHISKIRIPDSISTVNAINLFALSDGSHADALEISNKLFNISRDADSILTSKKLGDAGYDAFMKQCAELEDKLRNQASHFETEFKRAGQIFQKKGTEKIPKEILWEDGKRTRGVCFHAIRPSAVEKLIERWKLPLPDEPEGKNRDEDGAASQGTGD